MISTAFSKSVRFRKVGSNTNYLFVYGTLRKQLNHSAHDVLAQHGEFLDLGIFQGKLFDLGNYPGAVASRKRSDVIVGEIYILRDAELVFRVLDEYEGPKFRRQRLPVSLQSGQTILCSIYLYQHSTAGFKPIPSGDYLKYRKKA